MTSDEFFRSYTLRQFFQPDVGSRTLWFSAKRFSNGLCKFDRQRSLDADQRHSRFAVGKSHFDAVGGVRIDDHAMLLGDAANGGDAIRVGAAAGDK